MFTSESVTMGHPDKMADQISDAVLDAILAQDPGARVACETLVKTGVVIVAGEITTAAVVPIPDVVRETVKEIGFSDTSMGFDYNTCGVVVMLDKQSPDISMGVTASGSKEQGAGDQGLMFGYACNQTPELMPAPIMFAHKLCARLAQVRKSKRIPYLYSDGKSQVTVEYEDGKVKRIDSVVISTQHAKKVAQSRIKKDVIAHVMHAVEVASVDHVGFGSDFDGVPALPDGITDCTSWGAVLDALGSVELGDEDMEKIACDNWRRVFGV